MCSLCEPIGFRLVVGSSLRGPEGLGSRVVWEWTSGVVVIFRHFFVPAVGMSMLVVNLFF